MSCLEARPGLSTQECCRADLACQVYEIVVRLRLFRRSRGSVLGEDFGGIGVREAFSGHFCFLFGLENLGVGGVWRVVAEFMELYERGGGLRV